MTFSVSGWVIKDTGDEPNETTMARRMDHLTNNVFTGEGIESLPFSSKVFKITVFSNQMVFAGREVFKKPQPAPTPNKVLTEEKTPTEASSQTSIFLNTDTGFIVDGFKQLDEKLGNPGFSNLTLSEIPSIGRRSIFNDISASVNAGRSKRSILDPVEANVTTLNNVVPNSQKPAEVKDPFKEQQAKIESEIQQNQIVRGQGQYQYEERPQQFTLEMHIPPQEMTWNYQQEISRNKTRGGWVLERWGENMLTIDASGSSGVFYHSEQGLTRLNANSTYGYRELMMLAQIYRNNGMSYDPVSGVVYTIGEVQIEYDGTIYTGSFDSFDIKESSDSPYKFTYQFNFVSRGIASQVTVKGHYHSPARATKPTNYRLIENAIKESYKDPITKKLEPVRTEYRSVTTEGKAFQKLIEKSKSGGPPQKNPPAVRNKDLENILQKKSFD